MGGGRRRSALATAVVSASVAVALVGTLAPPSVSASGAEPDRFAAGIALGLHFEEAGRSYEGYLWEVARTGADTVNLVFAWYQADIAATTIRARDGQSPTDADLVRTIRSAHALGLDVMLMPILRLDHRGPGEWRGRLAPEDPDAWFAAYRTFILHYAAIAADEGVAWLSVGSELGSLEEREDAWRGLIDDVRATFSGQLTYSANWDRFERTPFWEALDAIGVSAYFELAESAEERPDVAALEAAWAPAVAALGEVSASVGRPVLITEVGYVSQAAAAWHPWDYTQTGAVDLQVQRDLYRALAASFSDAEFLGGVFLWNWFGDGGSGDDGYTPRHKPAEQVIRAWYARGASGL